MAQVMYQYYSAGLHRNQGVINLFSDTLKVALVSSAYTPDLSGDEVWGDVSSYEVASGDGYTTGGATLASKTLTRDTWKTTFDAGDVTWTSLTKTFRYAVIYKSGTVADPQGGADIVNPLFAYVLLDDTPADIVVAGVDYVLQWSSLGIAAFGPAASF